MQCPDCYLEMRTGTFCERCGCPSPGISVVGNSDALMVKSIVKKLDVRHTKSLLAECKAILTKLRK